MFDFEAPYDPYAVPLTCCALQSLASGRHYCVADVFSDDLDDDSDKFIYGMLTDATFDYQSAFKTVKPCAGDPFEPGRHFYPTARRAENGEITFSIMIYVEQAEASKILVGADQADISPLFHLVRKVGHTGADLVPIGYATLTTSFLRASEVLDEEDLSPKSYHFYVTPEAVFICPAFRGHGFGRYSGSLLASIAGDALRDLGSMSEALGVETEVAIDIYYEIYSKGGEAAVAEFLYEFVDYVGEDPDIEYDFGNNLKIVAVEKDGGW